MNLAPSWLPPIISVSGDWNKIIILLYKIFKKDFQYGKLYFQCYTVGWDTRILPGDSHEEGFWHLITKEDEKAGERLPDFRRAERLPWCAPTIRNSEDPVVKTWDLEARRGKIRTYLWLEKMDYVVVLEKRKNKKKVFLITAYYVEGKATRRSLMKKYNSRSQ